mmetsp:Transcript_100877/g.311131  ORF Transcript_100877/g.311131 Transcript_100877/m.311131 type:complete len:215 (+) Transcript_100877:102-746(+)
MRRRPAPATVVPPGGCRRCPGDPCRCSAVWRRSRVPAAARCRGSSSSRGPRSSPAPSNSGRTRARRCTRRRPPARRCACGAARATPAASPGTWWRAPGRRGGAPRRRPARGAAPAARPPAASVAWRAPRARRRPATRRGTAPARRWPALLPPAPWARPEARPRARGRAGRGLGAASRARARPCTGGAASCGPPTPAAPTRTAYAPCRPSEALGR